MYTFNGDPTLRSFTLRNFIEEANAAEPEYVDGLPLRSFTLRNFIEDLSYPRERTARLQLRSFTLRNFIEEGPSPPRGSHRRPDCEALRFATSLRMQPSGGCQPGAILRSFTLRNFIEERWKRPASTPKPSDCEALRFATSLRTEPERGRIHQRFRIAKLYASQLH